VLVDVVPWKLNATGVEYPCAREIRARASTGSDVAEYMAYQRQCGDATLPSTLAATYRDQGLTLNCSALPRRLVHLNLSSTSISSLTGHLPITLEELVLDHSLVTEVWEDDLPPRLRELSFAVTPFASTYTEQLKEAAVHGRGKNPVWRKAAWLALPADGAPLWTLLGELVDNDTSAAPSVVSAALDSVVRAFDMDVRLQSITFDPFVVVVPAMQLASRVLDRYQHAVDVIVSVTKLVKFFLHSPDARMVVLRQHSAVVNTLADALHPHMASYAVCQEVLSLLHLCIVDGELPTVVRTWVTANWHVLMQVVCQHLDGDNIVMPALAVLRMVARTTERLADDCGLIDLGMKIVKAYPNNPSMSTSVWWLFTVLMENSRQARQWCAQPHVMQHLVVNLDKFMVRERMCVLPAKSTAHVQSLQESSIAVNNGVKCAHFIMHTNITAKNEFARLQGLQVLMRALHKYSASQTMMQSILPCILTAVVSCLAGAEQWIQLDGIVHVLPLIRNQVMAPSVCAVAVDIIRECLCCVRAWT